MPEDGQEGGPRSALLQCVQACPGTPRCLSPRGVRVPPPARHPRVLSVGPRTRMWGTLRTILPRSAAALRLTGARFPTFPGAHHRAQRPGSRRRAVHAAPGRDGARGSLPRGLE